MKAIVLVLADDVADDVSRLIASALALNGYEATKPSVVDWPDGRVVELEP